MYIPSTLYSAAYSSILSLARGGGSNTTTCKTFILVSPDVDALCAAHLLATLLKTDDVLNTVIPVSSWSDLEATRHKLQHEDVRSLVLLNLGALVDLYSYFDYLPTTTLIHVIDSHRPVNLRNLFEPSTYATALFDARRRGGKGRRDEDRAAALRAEEEASESVSVVVWADREGEDSRDMEREAWEALQYEPDSDSDSDSDDSESDDDDGRKRGGRRRSGSAGDGDSEDEDMDGEGSGALRSKRRRTSNEPEPLTKMQRRRFRARIEKYYHSGTFFGQSVAGQIFLLAVKLERADTDGVWLAILGLTHQFVTNAIDRERYDHYVEALADEVARLSTTSSSLVASSDPLASTGPNDRSIRPSEELRFCLFRHWNLYDAMYHSGYLGSRMKLWTERGKKNLSGLLAKMGCPLSESSEIYQHMATDLKLSLTRTLQDLAPEYGLHDLVVGSFVRKNGYRTDLAAADAVEALGALLEVATGVRLDFGDALLGAGRRRAGGQEAAAGGVGGGREEWSEGLKSWVSRDGAGAGVQRRPPLAAVENGANGNGDVTGDEEDDDAAAAARSERKKAQQERDWALRNFWLAWDALDPDTTLLRSALPLSMALHRAVMDQGGYILEKQAIKSLRTYRLAVIKEGPDLAVFRHPSTLLRLALWLVDAVRDLVGHGNGPQAAAAAAGKRPKSLPFVLASLNEANDAFLVVGVVGAVEYGDVKKNAFGLAFQRAAHISGARTRHNAFEASVVEVRKDDLDKFLKDLAMA